MLSPAILQFGTGRFLLAHVDLFVSEALTAGRAVGSVLVVQSTRSPASAARTAALATGAGYPVRIRGFENGHPVDRTVQCCGVAEAVQADSSWARVCEAIASHVQVIVSNTADQGYLLDPQDSPTLLQQRARAPRSYPAKLLVLLHWRWLHSPQAPLSILPCELLERNGDTLRAIVGTLALEWDLPAPFVHWLGDQCVWANTLVDRIVSEPIEPVGAIAEPYALWAVERQPGLVMPCTHPAIVLTDELDHHERLKLFLLNAGHTFLADCWRRDGLAADFTVAQAMNDAALRGELEALWAEEIVPVFAAIGKRSAAERYLATLRERLLNPLLEHRLAAIAQNHAQKKQRRFAPIVSLAAQQGLTLKQPRLRAALAAEYA
ncbi:MAG TPA: mannitol dehydrogenase family protein [Burkholderiaceae bacterium]|nr:mannitol dehydrogenase family protein [Burkholderiaceae bacterium]